MRRNSRQDGHKRIAIQRSALLSCQHATRAGDLPGRRQGYRRYTNAFDGYTAKRKKRSHVAESLLDTATRGFITKLNQQLQG